MHHLKGPAAGAVDDRPKQLPMPAVDADQCAHHAGDLFDSRIAHSPAAKLPDLDGYGFLQVARPGGLLKVDEVKLTLVTEDVAGVRVGMDKPRLGTLQGGKMAAQVFSKDSLDQLQFGAPRSFRVLQPLLQCEASKIVQHQVRSGGELRHGDVPDPGNGKVERSPELEGLPFVAPAGCRLVTQVTFHEQRSALVTQEIDLVAALPEGVKRFQLHFPQPPA
jgi:hypothetical protein